MLQKTNKEWERRHFEMQKEYGELKTRVDYLREEVRRFTSFPFCAYIYCARFRDAHLQTLTFILVVVQLRFSSKSG